ncbi:MAG TPA: ABC transporter ATP-binding protein [Thermomicrobiaceae bacterium]|nr:ABC transporter ATP-binding protein [Thermomicrobiaceae bacterium]
MITRTRPTSRADRPAAPDARSRQHHTAAAAILARGLVKRFDALTAVDGLDLEVSPGETVALLGPNGAGKSTTIAMLLGLLCPDSGDLAVLGQEAGRAVSAGQVGVMLQDAGLMPGVTVGELLAFVRGLYRDPLSRDDLIETAGLEEFTGRRIDHLSGGQAQRVRFALAIAGNPDLILLDEPTTAMDVEGRHAFWERMRTMAATGKTILFATHYLEEADMAADRIVVVARGHKVADGTAAELKAGLGEQRVRFTLDGTAGPVAALRGVTAVERFGQRVTAYTRDVDLTVRDLATSDLPWRDLELETADLETAFLKLTGEVR